MRVSCLIAAWNAESTIVQCLRSAAGAGFDEILMVDDGSDDATTAIAQAMASTIPGLRLFKSPKNRGIIHTKQLLLKRSTGDAVLFLDSDDYLVGDISRLKQAIADGAAVACGSVVNGAGVPTGPVGPAAPKGSGPDVWYLLLSCHWPTSSALWHAATLKKISASHQFEPGPFELQALEELAIAGESIRVIPPPAIAFYRSDWRAEQASKSATSRATWVKIIKRAWENMPSDRRQNPHYERAYVTSMTELEGFTHAA